MDCCAVLVGQSSGDLHVPHEADPVPAGLNEGEHAYHDHKGQGSSLWQKPLRRRLAPIKHSRVHSGQIKHYGVLTSLPGRMRGGGRRSCLMALCD